MFIPKSDVNVVENLTLRTVKTPTQVHLVGIETKPMFSVLFKAITNLNHETL